MAKALYQFRDFQRKLVYYQFVYVNRTVEAVQQLRESAE